MLSVHTKAEGIQLTEITENVSECHEAALATCAMCSPFATVQQVGPATVYTLNLRCRAVMAVVSTAATSVSWDTEGTSKEADVVYPAGGARVGVTNIAPNEQTLVAMCIKGEV